MTGVKEWDPKRPSVSEIVLVVAHVCEVQPSRIVGRNGPEPVRMARHLVCRLAWEAGYPPRTIAERIEHHVDSVEASLRTCEDLLTNGSRDAVKLARALEGLRAFLGIRAPGAEVASEAAVALAEAEAGRRAA